MMKRILYILTSVLILLSHNCLATEWIDGFEDIPLMSGLKQIESQNFSFGNEESGYTEALLVSTHQQSFLNAKNFYKETLPKLGWTITDESEKNIIFTRENDVLEFTLQKKKPLKVLISLKSKN